MIIGIVGSRRRNLKRDYTKTVKAFLKIYTKGDTLVSGGCKVGGDEFAERIAKFFFVPIKIYPAEWSKFGKSAGFQRNTYIAQDADVLIAVVSEDRTGGTEDTISKYEKLGKTKLILV
jgi:hypothetical protein